ncbi:MAG: transposase [Chloroflexota bacterium]|nr:MAG: transposase [Chloroflexota bacterium]
MSVRLGRTFCRPTQLVAQIEHLCYTRAMLIQKAFKYRIYPNQAQKAALAVQFGHARFVYNFGLAACKAHYFEYGRGLNYNDTAYMLTVIKRFVPWLKEADSQVLQQSLKDLDRAYANYFEQARKGTLSQPQPDQSRRPLGGKLRKDGMPLGYPRFKSKDDEQSIRYPQRFEISGSRIKLPKVGAIRAVFHRPIEGEMKSCTVLRTKTGQYFISIQCELEIEDPVQKPGMVGIDLGLKQFAVLSSGEQIDHPQYLRKAERRLKRLQRSLSRTQKGSKGREKARLRLARQHQKVANQRQDFLHQASHRIVSEFGTIKIENLNVCGMIKNHHLAKSIADSGWSRFGAFLNYKGKWTGSQVERVDRFFPSSKTCSVCGWINQELQLHHRFWVCLGCGTEHDRDKNASVNLERYVPAERRERIPQGYTPAGITPVDNPKGWLKPEAQTL